MAEKALLIVEDDDFIRDTLKDILETEGFDVHVAFDGVAGLIEMHKMDPPPDAVLLDLMLPGSLSGWDFLVEKQKDPKLASIPVVIVTASPPPVARTHCLDGAAVLLHKPFDIDRLLAILRHVRNSDPGPLSEK